MSFGNILDQWEKESGRGAEISSSGCPAKSKPSASKKGGAERDGKINPMDAWLNRYGVQDKDAQPEALSRADKIRLQAEERRRLRSMKPEAQIDLHGLSAADAERELDSFFAECRRRDLRKILIVHGRGIHSEGQPVLSSIVKSYIERSPLAGEHGTAEPKDGGSGATWVILKKTE